MGEPHVAELRLRGDLGERLIAVRREAGKPYLLQHFYARRHAQVDSGRYWISALHSGYGEDFIDATGVLPLFPRVRNPYLVASSAIPLSSDLA